MSDSDQRSVQTQDVVDRLAAIFQPQLRDIKDQLANLITRREHEKDLAEVSADIAALQRDHDRLQDWADKRPRESADVTWVRRIEADVTAINTRLAAQPEQTRATLNTLMNGGGCLYMLIALAVVIVFNLITIGVSVALTLAIR